nr:MAG TPA: hypothetical protein [Caudoviricetes sp.]
MSVCSMVITRSLLNDLFRPPDSSRPYGILKKKPRRVPRLENATRVIPMEVGGRCRVRSKDYLGELP